MSAESDIRDLHAQASAAYQQGRATFVARLKVGSWGLGNGQVGSWMDSVDAVEAAGWTLDQWATCADPGGGFSAFPLFRRRPRQTTSGPQAMQYAAPLTSDSPGAPQDRA